MTVPAQDVQGAALPDSSLGHQQPVAIPADAVWIDAVQVRRRYGGRSHMWLERKIQNDLDFPEPTYFGRLRFWMPTALDAYDRVCAARTRARTASRNS
jgi:hypothetical protein